MTCKSVNVVVAWFIAGGTTVLPKSDREVLFPWQLRFKGHSALADEAIDFDGYYRYYSNPCNTTFPGNFWVLFASTCKFGRHDVKSMEKADFRGFRQPQNLALGAGGHQFESGRPDSWLHVGVEGRAVKTTDETPKLRAALAAAALVESGMVVGLGSGSTAELMVRRLGERVKNEGLDIIAVATSAATAALAHGLKIPVRELDDVAALNINLDGADEIDPQFQMIKGRGGALLREKIVATASRHRVTMITADKRVHKLGLITPIPVEVSPFGLIHTEARLQHLGARTTIRNRADGSPYLTDGGNRIIDCRFADMDDPSTLDRQLQSIAGVLETGLFLDLCDTLIVGTESGFDRLENRDGNRA